MRVEGGIHVHALHLYALCFYIQFSISFFQQNKLHTFFLFQTLALNAKVSYSSFCCDFKFNYRE